MALSDMAKPLTLTKQIHVLADAICRRIDQNVAAANAERRVHARAEIFAKVEAYYDSLGMLLASGEPDHPTVWCGLNVVNNPRRTEAVNYYREWFKSGRQYRMGE